MIPVHLQMYNIYGLMNLAISPSVTQCTFFEDLTGQRAGGQTGRVMDMSLDELADDPHSYHGCTIRTFYS